MGTLKFRNPLTLEYEGEAVYGRSKPNLSLKNPAWDMLLSMVHTDITNFIYFKDGVFKAYSWLCTQ